MVINDILIQDHNKTQDTSAVAVHCVALQFDVGLQVVISKEFQ